MPLMIRWKTRFSMHESSRGMSFEGAFAWKTDRRSFAAWNGLPSEPAFSRVDEMSGSLEKQFSW